MRESGSRGSPPEFPLTCPTPESSGMSELDALTADLTINGQNADQNSEPPGAKFVSEIVHYYLFLVVIVCSCMFECTKVDFLI